MHLFLSRIKVGEQFEAALPSQDSYSCELFYFLLHCTFLCGFFFVLRLVQPHLISVIVRFVLVFEFSLFMFNLVCRRLFQTGWSCSSLEVVKLTLFFHSLGCTLRIRCGDLELGFTQERAYHPYRTWLRSVMNSFRALFFVAPFVLLIVIAGCGGGGFHANNVTVTVSPAAATVAASGQVTLQATVHSLCSGCVPAVTWTITELQTNGASGSQCNWQGTTPPAGPCPDGTIQGADAPSALTVTYDAPSTSGTFHVVAEWCDCLANPPIIKDGIAVITVP